MESYERFGQNEAPKYITWSKQNRSRLLRLYDGESSSNDGFILRSPDSGINPYIAFAVILQAGLAGIREKAVLMDPLDKPSTEIDDKERMKLKQLPLSLVEAIDCAEGSDFITSLQDYDILHKFIKNIQEKENV
jgi:glutamine synthetase